MAPSPADARAAERSVLRWSEFDLRNGLRVIVHTDHTLPLVAVHLWYRVGSRDEGDEESGFAHLFEHMMFQGSAHVPANAHFRHVQEAGGQCNASTSFDRTVYHETLPAHALELGLWLEADRMRALAVTQESLDTQRDVVLEERRARYENQPYGTLFMELFAQAYDRQPYRRPVIGSVAHVRDATLARVRAFHAEWYRPDNAVLCVAGDADAGAVRALVERHFGDIPAGGVRQDRQWPVDPPRTAPSRTIVEDAVPLPAVLAGLPIPPVTDPLFPAMELLAEILGGGDSARLSRRLVREHRTARRTLAHALETALPGLLLLRADAASPGVTPELLEEDMLATLGDLRRDGVTDAERARACRRLEAQHWRGLERVEARAASFNEAFALHGSAGAFLDRPAAWRAVGDEDLRAAAALLTPERATVVHCVPRGGRTA